MSLVAQTLSQLGDLKTLEQEITAVLAAAGAALSSKQIGERIPNPPDGETLSREIYQMKKAGKIEHDPLAKPPAGSRGNVGMYRLVDNGTAPAPKRIVEPSFEEALEALKATARAGGAVDFTPGDEERLLPGGELAGPARADALAYAAMLPSFAHIAEDICLSDPDTVEFAIYSSGGLDIYCDDCAITLDRAVLAKLRAFLGLFQGELE